MSSPVKLYVYDLSNGLAKQLSLQLTGKQIDGIWHTSVVVFGKEVFYGQGISITKPGQSHHGQPLQIIDMGETTIDEQTFDEYINEMNEVYTADKYHLLDFNCNSFTNDCIGFLTGGSIPSWIKDLPSDFLSTPFGAALRPTIDNMYRRPTSGAASPQQFNQPLASSLLQSVASQAAGGAGPSRLNGLNGLNGFSGMNNTPTTSTPPAVTPSTSGASTVAAPLQVCSNQQHFNSILSTHKAVAAFFTSRTCPPCKIVEPVFEELAVEKSKVGMAFVKVDIGGGAMMGQMIASQYGVRVTPTFLFFLDGRKVYELKGADVGELRTQVDLMVYQAFPPHPHAKKNLPAIRSLSLEPILFSQIPPLDQVQAKLLSFIDENNMGNLGQEQELEKEKVKKTISTLVIPFLKTRTHEKLKGTPAPAATTKRVCEEWTDVTTKLKNIIKEEQIFPLIDLWRVGLLDSSVSSWCAAQWVEEGGKGSVQRTKNPILMFLEDAANTVSASTSTDVLKKKNVVLTTLRLLTNAFSNIALARALLNPVSKRAESPRQLLTKVIVGALLCEDTGVRTAAASLAFNVAVFYQKPRVENLRGNGKRKAEVEGEGEEGEGDWEVEMVSAIVEALRNETTSEDVVHRLVASLAFFLNLSPYYEPQIQPLLEVLQVKDILKAKLHGGEGGFGEKGVGKKDVKVLIEEVAEELCS